MVKSWKMFREIRDSLGLTDAMGLFGIFFLSDFDLDDDPSKNNQDGET